VASLLSFRDHPHRRAENGKHGSGKKKHGHGGDDTEVSVPVGTLVKDRDGAVLADLAAQGDRFLASEGGRGGRGNASFLSNRRRYPTFAEQGEVVEERWLVLELKLMADVALVGMPNVGKSTLISSVSRARPKIADYPFTTLEPNLGVVAAGEGREFVMADIPGLIEGAADGKGLGHQFLRHIDRARVLVILLDLAEWDGTSCADQHRILLEELGAYAPELLDRPRLVVGARADLVPQSEVPEECDLVISSVTRQGLEVLTGRLIELVDTDRTETTVPSTPVVHRLEAEGAHISRLDDASWLVSGREAERAVALSDLTNPDALDEAHRRLRDTGVNADLVAAGARSGDIVRIGDMAFEFADDDERLTGLD